MTAGNLIRAEKRTLREIADEVKRSARASIEKTPVKSLLMKKRQDKIEREIYDGISYIRNYIAVNRAGAGGTDSIVEELAEYSEILRPAYTRLLSRLRLNDVEGASDSFAEELGEKDGREYGRLLLRLDELPPDEMIQILTSYQKQLREMRITKLKKADELKSDLIYLPVVLNTMLVFINFMYVAYFSGQQEALLNAFTGGVM